MKLRYIILVAIVTAFLLMIAYGCSLHLHLFGTYQDDNNQPSKQGITIVVPDKRQNNDE